MKLCFSLIWLFHYPSLGYSVALIEIVNTLLMHCVAVKDLL